jgi:hypothetical protein
MDYDMAQFGWILLLRPLYRVVRFFCTNQCSNMYLHAPPPPPDYDASCNLIHNTNILFLQSKTISYAVTPNGPFAPICWGVLGLGFQILTILFYRGIWVDTYRIFFWIVTVLTFMLAVFSLLYGRWLASKVPLPFIILSSATVTN